jgi:ATP-dependent Lon protease
MKFKAIAYKKLQHISEDTNGAKMLEWIDSFLQIPFNKPHLLPPLLARKEKMEFLQQSQTTLDACAFGMSKAKTMLMELIAKWTVNPESMGTAIGLHGPMGTGKTTLVKHGVSKLMNNRPFAFVSLGGASEACFLDGHSYTYDGSTYGKIVDILIQTQCSNPIIFFDELDKVSDTDKGNELIHLLIHLTDSTQNTQFRDRYFSEIDFDLSKCLFIFSYNDETKINPILRDRLYTIHVDGYTSPEKVIIAKDYLLPPMMQEHGFAPTDVTWNDDVIQHIVQHKAPKEEGVRNLKRCLETILRKINMQRLVNNDLSFPLEPTMDMLHHFLEVPSPHSPYVSMYL